MDKQTQINFVTQLGGAVLEKIVADIEAGKTPEDWDGIELRWLLAERFGRCVLSGTSNKRRKREYNNTVLVNNL